MDKDDYSITPVILCFSSKLIQRVFKICLENQFSYEYLAVYSISGNSEIWNLKSQIHRHIHTGAKG